MPEPNTRLLVLIAVLALPLGGCASVTDFSVASLNPLKGSDPLRSADYNYFYKRDQAATGFVSAGDLVGPDGRCAFNSAPRAAPGEAIAASPDVPRAGCRADQPAQQPGALFHGGPADRAGRRRARRAAARGARRPARHRAADDRVPGGRHLGYTDRVEISANERGERSVTLTYLSGDRPGVYRFRNGRLVLMERVAEPAQQKRPPARTAKSKPAR